MDDDDDLGLSRLIVEPRLSIRWGESPRTTLRRYKAGLMPPAILIGRRRFYRVEDVAEFERRGGVAPEVDEDDDRVSGDGAVREDRVVRRAEREGGGYAERVPAGASEETTRAKDGEVGAAGDSDEEGER